VHRKWVVWNRLIPMLGLIAFLPIPKGNHAPTLQPTLALRSWPCGLGPAAALGSLPGVALSSAQVCSNIIAGLNSSNTLSRCCSSHSSLFSRDFKLCISASENLFSLPSKLGVWSYVADRAVKPNFVVMFHVIDNLVARIVGQITPRFGSIRLEFPKFFV